MGSVRIYEGAQTPLGRLTGQIGVPGCGNADFEWLWGKRKLMLPAQQSKLM